MTETSEQENLDAFDALDPEMQLAISRQIMQMMPTQKDPETGYWHIHIRPNTPILAHQAAMNYEAHSFINRWQRKSSLKEWRLMIKHNPPSGPFATDIQKYLTNLNMKVELMNEYADADPTVKPIVTKQRKRK